MSAVGDLARIPVTAEWPSGPSQAAIRVPDAEKRSMLQRHYFFGKLGQKNIERLAHCIVEKSLRRGAVIFAKGESGSSLFAICRGTVKISAPSADGHDAIFNLIGQGSIFGEIALLDGQPRTADATVMTDCILFVIERRDFLPLVREESEIAVKLMEVLCKRIRQTTDQAEGLMFLGLPGRLASTLLRLSSSNKGTAEQKIAITQGDLGNMIGTSRETINRLLRNWEERKWIRLERGATIILSATSLERIAQNE
jgi:CRP/FNR family cyclic AMP-dependent transcriptional regulator